MTLAANNITPRLANAEMGNPFGVTPNNLAVHDVCRYASQNKYSFYGPGVLTVDTSKNLVLTPPSNNDKLGDFRSYNHSAVTPGGANDFTWNWGPGGINTSPGIVSLPIEMNALFANANALYITYKAYLSIANRAAETSLYDSYTELATYNTITALIGHTRTQTKRIASTNIGQFVNLSTTGLTTPNDFIYLDTYLSDASGNRLVNLGAVADGYTTITMHEQQAPQINASGLCSSRPGYTGSHSAVDNTTARCGEVAVAMTFGSTAYSFYLRAIGYVSGAYNIAPTNCSVTLVHYNGSGGIRESKLLTSSVTLSRNNGVQFSSAVYGALANTWGYDDYGVVNIVASTWGTSRAC